MKLFVAVVAGLMALAPLVARADEPVEKPWDDDPPAAQSNDGDEPAAADTATGDDSDAPGAPGE
ncbi:MAG TPA: hypothetical protein VFP84_31175, partial [Kofleriaceae bacterium]|nr:hypothetical protein [Kofleriaceae bacterium]